MRIQVLSDIHTEFGVFGISDTDADVVVLAGDIGVGKLAISWAGEFVERPCVMVLGNHELYGQHVSPQFFEELRERAERYPHLHLLIDEQVVIDGVRFLGCALWTDLKLMGDPALAANLATEKMTDFSVIRTEPGYRKLRPADTMRWHERSLAWLRERLAEPHDGPTVVVTHHAPSLKSIPARYREDPLSACYASHLDDLVASSGAALWVHGHIHDSVDYEIGGTRVVCNPRGYFPEDVNREFDPRMIIELGDIG